MSIRDRRYSHGNPWARKENQEWDLAGMARQDGDDKVAREHTEKAREYADRAREWEECQE